MTLVEQRAMVIAGLCQDVDELALMIAFGEARISELESQSRDKDANIADLIGQLEKAEARVVELERHERHHHPSCACPPIDACPNTASEEQRQGRPQPIDGSPR